VTGEHEVELGGIACASSSRAESSASPSQRNRRRHDRAWFAAAIERHGERQHAERALFNMSGRRWLGKAGL
jgi:hypothetical protein